ncbi:unnamed protein product [Chondrus crispus]|uniref:Uncharacterized protein n=1 Tax=Chondrus crispus TaxID=2769 RepID=R7QB14_CHOCR|nr:unnamed protein product [Chondrus crispus]CDF34601.1 unnamed protein product [Chondrus crispus]|eukprot:XP_005714420.1 unnamed protein product [Chondrus crispus]
MAVRVTTLDPGVYSTTEVVETGKSFGGCQRCRAELGEGGKPLWSLQMKRVESGNRHSSFHGVNDDHEGVVTAFPGPNREGEMPLAINLKHLVT